MAYALVYQTHAFFLLVYGCTALGRGRLPGRQGSESYTQAGIWPRAHTATPACSRAGRRLGKQTAGTSRPARLGSSQGMSPLAGSGLGVSPRARLWPRRAPPWLGTGRGVSPVIRLWPRRAPNRLGSGQGGSPRARLWQRRVSSGPTLPKARVLKPGSRPRAPSRARLSPRRAFPGPALSNVCFLALGRGPASEPEPAAIRQQLASQTRRQPNRRATKKAARRTGATPPSRPASRQPATQWDGQPDRRLRTT